MIFISSCSAQGSQYLVGRWSYDPERTLAELKVRENVPPKIISCYEKQVCGYYIEIEYTPNTWQSILIKSDNKHTEPVSYVAKEKSESEIVVNTKELGKDVEYKFVKLSNNLMYIELEFKGFKWKEYLKRKK